MPSTRPPYPPQLREQLVALVKAGRAPEELARDYEPSAQTIRNWVAADAAERDPGQLGRAERDELSRLRRENRILREEREILRKAAAWFAAETDATPGRRSRS